ncbi:cathepsin L [Vigna unguiculata]|uniref:Cathepsin L n=1 Tax=Vigna unguiculata TaxID=3917 RepID=A0A4D6KJJ2_VIGUN|nr:cathepsin L [Vigna unguiculata]
MATSVQMKHVFAVCAVMLLTCAYQAMSRTLSESSVAEAFQHWKSQHGRQYVDDAEKGKRFKIFAENLEYIEKFNNGGKKSYKLGLNPFSDLTEEEFIASHTGLKLNSSLPRSSSATHLSVDDDNIPPSMDWRERGAVTDVKDQGQCGSCWAFSTVAAVEGIVQIKTKKLIPLSEQQLVDCDNDNKGCDGGFMDNAFNYIKENEGISSESDYPYQGFAGTCQSAQPAVQISGYKDVPENSEEQLLLAVAQQPVSVVVAINQNFQSYESDVFEGPCGTELNHAVTIIGYDTTDDGKKYWLIKNSWGESWGENGYMKLLRESGEPEGVCGVAMKASYPTLDLN